MQQKKDAKAIADTKRLSYELFLNESLTDVSKWVARCLMYVDCRRFPYQDCHMLS